MNKKGNIVLGGILVIFGLMLLFNRVDLFNFSNYWALVFIVLPGLAFHYAFFAGGRKQPGLLVPGGTLLVIGLTCQISDMFGVWHIMWPGFLAAVAFGLFELYYFGSRAKGLLVPIAILGSLSIIFFFTFSLGGILSPSVRRLIAPVIIILLGLILLLGGAKKEHN